MRQYVGIISITDLLFIDTGLTYFLRNLINMISDKYNDFLNKLNAGDEYEKIMKSRRQFIFDSIFNKKNTHPFGANRKIFLPLFHSNENIGPDSEFYYLKSEVQLNPKITESKEIFYKLNSDGFRSDNFKKEHNGLHILFAGCSETFGNSSNINENWSYLVYDELKKKHKVSGYFNLGHPGSNHQVIIHQILIYILKYSKPDLLLVNFPNSEREFMWEEGGIKLRNRSNEDVESFSSNQHFAENLYNVIILYNQLSLICDILNIKLIFSNFNPIDSFAIKTLMNFENFVSLNNEKEFLEYASTLENFKDHPHFLLRRDGSHRGIAFHKYWAKKFLDKIEEVMV